MYERHTCLFISRLGRERILSGLKAQGSFEEGYEKVLLPEVYAPGITRHEYARQDDVSIPGIVRREEVCACNGMIPIGFSSWQQPDGRKLRIAAFTAPDEVVAVFTPQDVLSGMRQGLVSYDRTAALRALLQLMQYEDSSRFLFGAWGSAAMELLTGYFYTRDDSDLDVWLRLSDMFEDERNTMTVLRQLMDAVSQCEMHFSTRIDIELALPNDYGISLKEFFGAGSMVLAKGLNNVVLLPKSDVFATSEKCLPLRQADAADIVNHTLSIN